MSDGRGKNKIKSTFDKDKLVSEAINDAFDNVELSTVVNCV